MVIPRLNWNSFFMMHAHLYATRSTCNRGPKQLFNPDRSGTGAVLVRNNMIVAGGYNGSPPGYHHCDDADHIMVDGHCVTGDTVISKFQTGHYNSRHRTIEYIYNNWNIPRNRSAMKKMKIRCMSSDGMIVPGSIVDVWMSGKKRVYKVETFLGRSVETTSDHLFYTPGGYLPLGELSVDDLIALNGMPLEEDTDWMCKKYKDGMTVQKLAKVIRRSRGFVKRRLLSNGCQLREYNGGWNRGMRGEGMPGFRGDFVSECQARVRSRRYALGDKCGICGSLEKLEVHHLDKNVYNYADDNLVTLCMGCHGVAHTPHAKLSHIVWDKIVSIKYVGWKDVYDLTTVPYHNFIGNGIVLHNCVQTLHAELNALIQCAKVGVSSDGCTMYTTTSPCWDCAKAMIRAGVKQLYFGDAYDSRYGMSAQVKGLLNDCGVMCYCLPKENLGIQMHDEKWQEDIRRAPRKS